MRSRKALIRSPPSNACMHQFGNTLPRRNDEMAKAADSVISKFMRLVRSGDARLTL